MVVLPRGDAEQAVGVDAEGDLQPGQAGGHGGDALEHEARERAAVGGELALALDDVQVEAGLPVGVGGEDLPRAGRDGGVAGEDLLGHAAHGLEAEREREHVEQEHLALAIALAGEEVGLDGGAERHHLVGVDVAERLLAEEPLHVGAHAGTRVEPPTRITPSRASGLRPASRRARRQATPVRSTQGRDEGVELARG